MAEDNTLNDLIKTDLMMKNTDSSESLKIVGLIGIVLVAGIIYLAGKGLWSKHVTPLYSRSSNPIRRKKRKARNKI